MSFKIECIWFVAGVYVSVTSLNLKYCLVIMQSHNWMKLVDLLLLLLDIWNCNREHSAYDGVTELVTIFFFV